MSSDTHRPTQQRTILLLALTTVVLFSFLTACSSNKGSTQSTPGSTQVSSGANAASQAAGSDQGSAPGTEVAGEPNSSPAATATETAQPGGAVPGGEASPTEASAQDTSQTSGGESTACTHPYYPVVPGATWTYTVSGGPSGGFSYTDTLSDVRADGFTRSSQFPELLRTQEWACSPAGLVALQYAGGGSGSVSTSGSTASFVTTSVTGVTLPASIQAGDHWSQAYEIQGTQTMPDGQSADSTGKVTYDFTAIGIEPVSLAGGEFQAMRIDFNMVMEITISLSGITVPTTITSVGSSWYAPDVGWVKTADSGTFFEQPVSEIIELSSYTIPGK